MGKWVKTTVGEFCPFEYGTALKESDRQTGFVPVYGSNGIVGYHNIAYVNTRGVIIGRKGTVGAIHYSDKHFFPIDTTFYISETENKDIRFIYYLLKSLGLEHMNSDSAVPGLNRKAAHSRILRVPESLAEQQTIAGILGTMDDKIELNRRMNRIMENIAQAVFTEMMKDEGGKMKVEKLGDICEFAYGKGLKEDKRQAGSIPVYGSNGQIGWNDQYLVKGPGIVVGRKGNPGIVTWVQNDFFPIDTTFYVVPKNSKTSLYWIYYTLTSLNLPDLGADSAVPGLNRNIAYMSDIDYPSEEMMNRLDTYVIPIFNKINANEKESRTVASLRDTLLPKLINGEIL